MTSVWPVLVVFAFGSGFMLSIYLEVCERENITKPDAWTVAIGLVGIFLWPLLVVWVSAREVRGWFRS